MKKNNEVSDLMLFDNISYINFVTRNQKDEDISYLKSIYADLRNISQWCINFYSNYYIIQTVNIYASSDLHTSFKKKKKRSEKKNSLLLHMSIPGQLCSLTTTHEYFLPIYHERFQCKQGVGPGKKYKNK